MTPRRYVLLDRDGTIIVERHYLSDPREVELIAGAAEGLRELARAGFGLILVTNQSGIGRGYFDESTLTRIHERLSALLATHEVRLDGVYYCPHAPVDDCACRKPRTAMAEQAAKDHGFSLQDCTVIGDNIGDVQLARALGATSILVETGHGAKVRDDPLAQADFLVANFGEAARVILDGRVAPTKDRQ